MKRQNLRTVSLIVVTFTYLLIGAAIFGYLESEHEIKQREYLELIELIIKRKYNISDDDYTVLTTTVIKSVPHKAGIQWKFPGAFYFATTVVTTIGYGHSTPATMAGRSFCMIYALIGIPLGLVMFQSIGERLNTIVGCALKYSKRCFKAKNPEVTQTNLVMVVSVLSTILMTSMAAVFAKYERWDYFDALYYCFITLTTIGFGDYVALQKESALQSKPEYVALSLIFILFGLSVVSSAVNLLVLKFLTLNTEDERRDEQLRYTANLNPILLEGDVITSSTLTPRQHQHQHQQQQHLQHNQQPPNEHQLAIYRPQMESPVSTKSTMRRRLAQKEANNNSNDNNLNAALWPTKSISNLSSSFSIEQTAANSRRVSGGPLGHTNKHANSSNSNRSIAIEQLLPLMLVNNSTNTGSNISHSESQFVSSSHARQKFSSPSPSMTTTNERLINLSISHPVGHQNQHYHPHPHPHRHHHRQPSMRQLLHQQSTCSQEELCSSFGHLENVGTEMNLQHNQHDLHQIPFNEQQQQQQQHYDQNNESEQHITELDDDEDADGCGFKACACEACLINSIKRAAAAATEGDHEFSDCNHGHQHEDDADDEHADNEDQYLHVQQQQHRHRSCYHEHDGSDLANLHQHSPPPSLASPRDNQQQQRQLPSPHLSDLQQLTGSHQHSQQHYKFQCQKQTGLVKQQKLPPTADYQLQRPLTPSAHHHYHHINNNNNNSNINNNNNHHHHHQHQHRSQQLEQPQLLPPATAKTSERWLKQPQAYCDSSNSSSARWRYTDRVQENINNANTDFTIPGQATSSCSCSWISVVSSEQATTTTNCAPPIASDMNQMANCRHCLDEGELDYTHQRERLQLQTAGRRRSGSQINCSRHQRAHHHHKRRRPMQAGGTATCNAPSDECHRPLHIQYPIQHGESNSRQQQQISSISSGQQSNMATCSSVGRLLSCSGLLLDRHQQQKHQHHRLSPNSMGDLGTLDVELLQQQQQQQQRLQPQQVDPSHHGQRVHRLTSSKSSGSLAESFKTQRLSNPTRITGVERKKSAQQQQQQQQAGTIAKLVCKCCCEHLECIEHALACSQSNNATADRKPSPRDHHHHSQQPLSSSMETTPKSGAMTRFASSMRQQHQLTSSRSALTSSDELRAGSGESNNHVASEKRPSDPSVRAQASPTSAITNDDDDGGAGSRVAQQASTHSERVINVGSSSKVESMEKMPIGAEQLISSAVETSGSQRFLSTELASNNDLTATQTFSSTTINKNNDKEEKEKEEEESKAGNQQ